MNISINYNKLPKGVYKSIFANLDKTGKGNVPASIYLVTYFADCNCF